MSGSAREFTDPDGFVWEATQLTSFFRIFTVIPIGIVAAAIEGGSYSAQAGGAGVRYAGGGIGILVVPVVLMLLFRKKYPR